MLPVVPLASFESRFALGNNGMKLIIKLFISLTRPGSDSGFTSI